MAWNLDIWYVASPSRPLPRLFKLCPMGQNWPLPGVYMFYIGLYGEKHETIFLSETTMRQCLDIWYEASPSEPLPSLFKLYPWGQIWRHPRGHVLDRPL